MSDDKYNGWTNYETWAANLWLSNDEGTMRMVDEMASQTEDRYELANDLKGLIEDLAEEFQESAPPHFGLFDDLLTTGLQRINWREIASQWGD